jgi:[acyl-carrier-protein] S-malonyltransferase
LNQPEKTAFVFPGQGAQAVGMGRDLYSEFAAAREVFELADARLGFPLSQLIFEGPEDELTQTINTQPAIVTVSLACLKALKESAGALPVPAFTAGHSLGEYTALAAAGVIGTSDAIFLARERGRLMHRAGQENPGGMAAVLGLEEDMVSSICAESGCHVANYNCPGQLVISGNEESLSKAITAAEAKGARRVVRLAVSGAFHTPLMQPAIEGMAAAIETLDFKNPQIPLVGNTTARALTTAAEIKEELLNQLTSGVKWQQSVELMLAEGVTTFIEIGSGRVLSGLIKRINKEAATINVGDAGAVKGFANT